MITKRITEEVFSALHNNKYYVEALRKSSPSEAVARHRDREFQKVFSNAMETYETMRFFSSGSSAFPNLGVVLGVSSVLSYITSFSGFLALEVALEQANSVRYFLDMISVVGNSLMPAVGRPTYSDGNLSRQRQSQTFTHTAAASITINFGHILVPRTFRAIIQVPLTPPAGAPPRSAELEIRDDGNGGLLAIDGLLQGASSINYTTGVVTINTNAITAALIPNLPAGYTVAGTPNAQIDAEATLAVADPANQAYPVAPNETRFRPRMTRTVTLNTFQSQLVSELSIPDVASYVKSLNLNLEQWLSDFIATQYTAYINRYLVRRLQDAWNVAVANGATDVIIDLTSVLAPGAPTPLPTWNAYQPVVDKLMGEMRAVDLALHRRGYRGGITALLVSSRLYSWLARTELIDPANWQEEKNNFLDNLKGYYRGIPVLVHTDLDALDSQTNGLWNTHGFAVHVMPDGQLAPLVRGIYLPATALPVAINYNNLSQQAIGIYFQEGVEPLAHELVQRFRVQGLPN